MAAEAALAAVLAATLVDARSARIGWYGCAALLLIAGFARVHRRWLWQWTACYARFAVRARAPRRRTSGPAELARLGLDGDVVQVDDDDGVGATAIVYGSSLVLIVAAEDHRRLRLPGRGDPLPALDIADAVLRAGDVELAEIQILQRIRPAPSATLPEQARAARSYGELAGGAHPAAVSTFVALRLDLARNASAIAARGGGTTGAYRAARRSLHRLVGVLSRYDIVAHPIGDDLPAVLAACCASEPLPGAGDEVLRPTPPDGNTGETAPAEQARLVRTGPAVHTSFEVLRWPITDPPAALALLGSVPVDTVHHAVALRREDRGLTVTATIRLTAGSTSGLAYAERVLRARARTTGVGLRRLDHLQLPALFATLPLGGSHAWLTSRRHLLGSRGHATQLVLDPAGAGIVVATGRTSSGEPNAVPGAAGFDSAPLIADLFGPNPLSACLVGGLYAATLIAFRAAATGARVVIETGRPHAWEPLARSATADVPAISVVRPAAAEPSPASESWPLLHIYDLGAVPPAPRLAQAPWQVRLTLLPYLNPGSLDALAHANVLAFQRISPGEVDLLWSLSSLPDAMREVLPTLPDDALEWLDGGSFTSSRLVPTSVELATFGAPRRVDAP